MHIHKFCSSLRNFLVSSSAALLFVISAAAQKVSTDYDHKVDSQRFHTFSIYKLQASNPLVEQRLHDALVRDLSARGLQRVPQGGDLAITAVGTRGTQQEYSSFYEGLGGGFGWRGRGFGGGFGNDGLSNTQVINIPVGTLVIDLYDGSQHQLLFRGVANDTLSDKEEKNSKKLQKAIDKIFDKYPTKAPV